MRKPDFLISKFFFPDNVNQLCPGIKNNTSHVTTYQVFFQINLSCDIKLLKINSVSVENNG